MMILKRLSDNVVMYADDKLTLTSEYAKGAHFIDYNLTTLNATLEESSPLPANWTGLAYAYAKGDWTVFDQSVLDARANSIAERAAAIDKEAAIKKAREAALEKLLMENPEYAALVATKITE